ncbi:MAG: AAA family ATPase [Cyclobacteriaceae bacterium]
MSDAVASILRRSFPHTPTRGQEVLFQQFARFWKASASARPCLLLRGYAGTGKTSLISAIVKSTPQLGYRYVLMAPTGRAAKVMSGYAKRAAFTIHKKIYKPKSEESSGSSLAFSRQKNYYKKTLFIVDEASMLSESTEFGGGSLLSDLIRFVFEDESNRLILVGDNAQLPPVHQLESKALDKSWLIEKYKLDVYETELTEVMRQEQESGILNNATTLREELVKKEFSIRFKTSGYPDIYRMTGERIEDGLRYAYDKFGNEDTIIICRSNRSAVQYNEYIRRSIFWQENEIEAGDYLMIVRNNYTFLPETAAAGFLANGDFVEVMKIVSFEELYGLRFATLELRLLDYPDQEPFEAKVILDTLHSHAPSLPQEDNRRLYQEVMMDYSDLASKTERMKAVRKDPYLNALQVKFAYALTCHKSQGGQWKAVFVDQGYLPDEQVDKEYIRWLYTAVTRAKSELYLVNFHSKFF